MIKLKIIKEEAISTRKLYAQYYTQKDVSSILIEKLGHLNSLSKIIDLSMGKGSLLLAAKSIYPDASLYGCDIDEKNVNTILKDEKFDANVFHIDSTSTKLEHILKDRDFDLVLGNPPFGFTEKNSFITEILEEFDCNFFASKVPLELFFILLGIRYLKTNATLSYIIPDGLLTNKRYEKFREILFNNYRVISVIYLGKKKFEATEACTHIITIKKKKLKTPYKVKLESIEFPESVRHISKKEFITRADYTFHSKPLHINTKKLSTFNVEIIRGRFSNKELLTMSTDFIHTTSFSNTNFKVFENDNIYYKNSKLVRGGDIVIARVGTRAIGKVGIISRGCFHISDCIIAIRVENSKFREAILNTLKSPTGTSWLQSASKGVAARHITITDLKDLPIFI
jgi:type I restriction-modification system DNA methylase subunit